MMRLLPSGIRDDNVVCSLFRGLSVEHRRLVVDVVEMATMVLNSVLMQRSNGCLDERAFRIIVGFLETGRPKGRKQPPSCPP